MGRKYFWGGLVIILGLILFLEAAGLITGNIWRYFWAILLVIIGLGIMFPDK